jgi:pimeloyl-ACP methyl ester carboxylesterase
MKLLAILCGNYSMMSLIIAVLIIVFLTFPLLTYAIYWYEAGNSPYKDELAIESGQKTAIWILKGFFSTMVSQIFMIIFYPLVFLKKLWQPEPEPNASLPPVILIHGLYHNASAWIFYRWWLRRSGFSNVYAFSYNSWKDTFWEIFHKFDLWVSEIYASFPGEPILFVGHSLGGLLAKAYAGKDGPQGNKVAGVITLGSPHKGSKLTVYGMGRLAKSLAYDSSLMQRLEGIEMPSATFCVSLYSPVDNIVLPIDSLKPPPGWKQERTNPICHISMLYHRPTFRRVLTHLKALSKIA